MNTRVVRRSLAVLVVGVTVTVACPKDDPFVPAVTTITVSPSTRTFVSLGLTQQFTATVLDQRGNAMTGQVVVWGTSSGTVASVTTAGLVTAVSGGSANITATIGTVSGSAMVTVGQVAAQLFKFDGDAQAAGVGAQVPVPLVASVLDGQGFGVQNVTVTFAVTAGGGSVGTPSGTTNSQGRVSTTWTLGSNTGPQNVTASSSGLTPVVFTATALAGAADTIIKNTADGGTVPAGTAVNPAPAVLVRDAASNPVSGINVTFVATQGGGQVTSANVATNGSGIATVGSWIVGASGAQELTATATGSGIGGNPITFTATAQPAGAATSIIVSSGNNQTGLTGFAVNTPPAALVRDASNNPVQGVTVNFAVTVGGGSVTSATATTNLQGIASVGWTINAGANTLTASVAGIATPATFNATGVASTFNITLRNVQGSSPTAPQQAAFDSAAARWSRVIFGDLSDVPVSIPAGACGRPEIPASNETVDDVLIFVMLVPIDGVGGILGSAGPCSVRGSNSLTVYGLMRFDTADLGTMEGNGTLRDVILHEMGHVLGLGTLWNLKGLLTGGGTADPYFTGAQANARFDEIGGIDYTGGGTVPVENCVGIPGCGAGTRDGHWRELNVFDNELMTGYIDIPAPLSVVTAAQFTDLGYQVNLGETDAFTLSFLMRSLRAAGGGVHLRDDIYRTPILVMDAAGRVVRVVQPN